LYWPDSFGIFGVPRLFFLQACMTLLFAFFLSWLLSRLGVSPLRSRHLGSDSGRLGVSVSRCSFRSVVNLRRSTPQALLQKINSPPLGLAPCSSTHPSHGGFFSGLPALLLPSGRLFGLTSADYGVCPSCRQPRSFFVDRQQRAALQEGVACTPLALLSRIPPPFPHGGAEVEETTCGFPPIKAICSGDAVPSFC